MAKSLNIYFDDDAIRDLEIIYQWIAADSVMAARSVDQRLRDSIRRLAIFPLSGRRGVGRTRELVIPQLPYVVVYEVDLDRRQIVISQVVHMSRDRSSAP